MSCVRLRVIILLSIILLVGILSVINSLGRICPAELVAKSAEAPVVMKRDNDFLCTGITQIVSDDENIYILYGRYSVVQVYTHDGVYCYSISVYNHANGRTQIASYENCLYICDKVNNIYIFENGKMKQYIDLHESDNIRSKISFGVWDSDYTVRYGSVWHYSDGSIPRCVIQRPVWLALYQNDMLTLLNLMLFASVGAILLIPKKPKNRN